MGAGTVAGGRQAGPVAQQCTRGLSRLVGLQRQTPSGHLLPELCLHCCQSNCMCLHPMHSFLSVNFQSMIMEAQGQHTAARATVWHRPPTTKAIWD